MTPKAFLYAITIAILAPLTAALWTFYLLLEFAL